jgi:hypothetical protein
MTAEIPLFVKLRGAYFHEDGYCLDASCIAPMGLRKTSNAVFASLDENGKPFRIAQVPGCEGTQDPQIIIALTPWPDPAQAKAALLLACRNLEGALDGEREAKEKLADFWIFLLTKCLPLDEQTQMAAYNNLCGVGRVMDTLNRFGSLKALKLPDRAALIDEALGIAA